MCRNVKTFRVVDLQSNILDANSPSLHVQILSISCSFWEKKFKSYVGSPHLVEIRICHCITLMRFLLYTGMAACIEEHPLGDVRVVW